MKNYKKILLLLLGILIIAGTTYAWKAGGGVKWIGESTEEQKNNRFIDRSNDIADYGTGYFLDTYTNLKWQAHDTTPGDWNGTGHMPKWASGSTNSDNDNYLGKYPEPVWDTDHYIYNPPSGGVDTDYEIFKYCEGIGDHHWRVPTKKEFMSIMTDIKPSGMNYYTALPCISYYNYWSSISSVFSSSSAYNGLLNSGNVAYITKESTYIHTICIHD